MNEQQLKKDNNQLEELKNTLKELPKIDDTNYSLPTLVNQAILYGKLQQFNKYYDTDTKSTVSITDIELEIQKLEGEKERNKRDNSSEIEELVVKKITPAIQKLENDEDSTYSLDIEKATIVKISKESITPLPLSRIGSGESIALIKLCSYIELHRFLKEKQRPVPNFLVIDQLSQVYHVSTQNKDRAKLDNIYDYIKDILKAVQCIILEHDIPTNQDDFNIITWLENGDKLIPTDWIDTVH